jgi:hypothetical protein
MSDMITNDKKDYELTDREKTIDHINDKISKGLPVNNDLNDCLDAIGIYNCKELYKYLRTVYRNFKVKSIDIDKNSNTKIYSQMHRVIGDVTIKSIIYNTNSLMDPIYNALEIAFVLDFKCDNNGLKVHKEIKVNGSQDFGGCTPKEVWQLVKIIRKHC